MNGLNLSNIIDAKLGGTQVSTIYFGSTKIWDNYHDYSQDYLTIEPTADNDYGVDLFARKSNKNDPNVTISYSTDLINWTSVTVNSTSGINIGYAGVGEKLYLKGVNNKFSYSYSTGVRIYATDPFKVSGNIMSLLYGDNFKNQTTLEYDNSFTNLFNDTNTGLSDISNLVLPATTLTQYCYKEMFKNCKLLTSAPSNLLPATTLALGCYNGLFSGCSGLIDAPLILPATTLQIECYRGLFYGCSSLINGPSILPATTLTSSCYYNMFYGCKKITTAPILPATTLTSSCYYQMFYNCNLLKYIECFATAGINSSNSTSNWVYGVAASGTFSCNPNTSWTNGNNDIPFGWTKDYWSYYKDEYFSVTSSGNTYVLFYLTEDYSNGITFQYSSDKTNWSTFNLTNTTGQQISINANQPMYFRIQTPMTALYGNGPKVRIKGNYYYTIKGNINSLLFGEDFKNYDESVYSSNTFRELFKEDLSLISAEWLVLPAMTLSTSCYRDMFKDCVSLTTPPKLPATTLAARCYNYMFQNCYSLPKAPELPATTMQPYCYAYMFESCESLATTPELPATTLAQYCYANMFPYCAFTSISLPAAPTEEGCYRSMFYGCTSLTSATILATSLATKSCQHMFNGCTSLSSITCMATSKESDSTSSWLYNASASGTFFKDPNATIWSSGSSGIPSGWTVQNAT